MTWEIVVGIIALIGVFGTVGAWIFKLSRILATLESTMQQLNRTLDDFKRGTNASIDKLAQRIDLHETRIIRLEDKHS